MVHRGLGDGLGFINPQDVNTFHPLNVESTLLPETSKGDFRAGCTMNDFGGLYFVIEAVFSNQIPHD